jgi:hypothetical protein
MTAGNHAARRGLISCRCGPGVKAGVENDNVGDGQRRPYQHEDDRPADPAHATRQPDGRQRIQSIDVVRFCHSRAVFLDQSDFLISSRHAV